MSDVKVSLEHFEGPLALLLYLIRKEEMDIMNINIVQITDQYLAFVKNMKTLDLELAGDFIAMAATLIQIKSRMLMPKELLTEEEEEDLEESKQELFDRLREYKKFQEASKMIYESPLLGRDVWSKGYKEKNFKRPDDVVKVEDNPLYALIVHYKKALKGVKKTVHRVGLKLQSIASRVMEIKVHLTDHKKTSLLTLAGLPSDFTTDFRSRLLITFLSTLELSKMGFVRLFQSQNYSDIHMDVVGDLDGDVVSQVEDYESLNDELQTELFMDSKIDISQDTDFVEENDEDSDVATDDDIEAAEMEIEGN
jgi:segregation and condensation protein A